MVNQIQLSQISDFSVSPQELLHKQTLNQTDSLVIPRDLDNTSNQDKPLNQINRQTINIDNSELSFSRENFFQSSQKNTQETYEILQNKYKKSLNLPENYNSINEYSSIQSLFDLCQQQDELQNNFEMKNIQPVSKQNNLKSYRKTNSGKKEIFLDCTKQEEEHNKKLSRIQEGEQNNFLMNELTFSFVEELYPFQDNKYCDNIAEVQQKCSNNNFDISSLNIIDNETLNNINNSNFININQNNPTIPPESDQQAILDPLLQNLNVKKMCEVQRQFCKKRIREFKQPVEEIFSYQDFISMTNKKNIQDKTLYQHQNQNVKTDHQVNQRLSLSKNKENINQQQFSNLNKNKQILNNSYKFNDNQSKSKQTQYQTPVNNKPQQIQSQVLRNDKVKDNKLRQQQQNYKSIQKNQKQKTTYTDLIQRAHQLKEKVKLEQQNKNHSHKIINSNQFEQQFIINKENQINNNRINNQVLNQTIENNLEHNQNSNIDKCYYQSSTFHSIDSQSNFHNIKNRNLPFFQEKNKQCYSPSKITLKYQSIPDHKQTQLLNQSKINQYNSQSHFYSQDNFSEKELKNTLKRDSRQNNKSLDCNRNSTSNNNQGSNHSINQSISQNTTILSNIHPHNLSRQRIMTVDRYDKKELLSSSINSNNSLSRINSNKLKSNDFLSNSSFKQTKNISKQNIVSFDQCYFKRKEQQQVFKRKKSLKQLNFSCQGYIKRYKDILECHIKQNIYKISKDDIIQLQNQYKQSTQMLINSIGISSSDDLIIFQDFLSLRSKDMFNQFLIKCGIFIQI